MFLFIIYIRVPHCPPSSLSLNVILDRQQICKAQSFSKSTRGGLQENRAKLLCDRYIENYRKKREK